MVTKRRSLNVLYELSLLIDDTEVLRHIDDSKSPISSLSIDDTEYHKLINQMGV